MPRALRSRRVFVRAGPHSAVASLNNPRSPVSCSNHLESILRSDCRHPPTHETGRNFGFSHDKAIGGIGRRNRWPRIGRESRGCLARTSFAPIANRWGSTTGFTSSRTRKSAQARVMLVRELAAQSCRVGMRRRRKWSPASYGAGVPAGYSSTATGCHNEPQRTDT
jgi:hypothetical protein